MSLVPFDLHQELSAEHFLNGTLLLVDKPKFCTSFFVVNRIRLCIKKRFNLRKIKVGHAGTLDPLASGLMLICTGKFTKEITGLTLSEKGYKGSMVLGASTPSYDLETQPNRFFATRHITKEILDQARQKFTGQLSQRPPDFSAKQIKGKRAYDLARKGEQVDLKLNKITINSFEVSGNIPELTFQVHCSKGTYIRSLVHDYGRQLNSGAYLSDLRRISVGDYTIDQSVKLNQCVDAILRIER